MKAITGFWIMFLLFFGIAVPVGLAEEILASVPTGNIACRIEVRSKASENHRDAEGKPDIKVLGRLPILTRIDITRFGTSSQYRLHWIDGKETEAWYDEASGFSAQQHRRTGKVIVGTGEAPIPSLANLSNGAVNWIRPEDSKGAAKFDGKAASHFARSVRFADGGEVTYQAWIDPETKWPLALDDGANVYKFTFEPAPNSPLVIPSVFESAIERIRAAAAPPRRL